MATDLELQGLRRELSDTRAVMAFDQPAMMDMAWLREHWPAWGAARIKRELAVRVGLTFTRGQSIEVPRGDVVEIDAQIEAEAELRRTGSRPVLHRRFLTVRTAGAKGLRDTIAKGFGLLLVTAGLSLGAMEIRTDPSCSPAAFGGADDSHHSQHFAGGMGLGALAYTGATLADREPGTRYLIAIGVTAITATAWEFHEQRNDGALVDPADIAWTTFGGLLGAVVADRLCEGLGIGLDRDEVSASMAWRF